MRAACGRLYRVEGMPIAMGGSGGDRLSRVLRHSTIGAGVFNGRVRDGIGFWARRSGHQTGASQFFWDSAAQGAATASVVSGKHAASSLRVFVVACVSGSPALRRPIQFGHGSRERSSQSGD